MITFTFQEMNLFILLISSFLLFWLVIIVMIKLENKHKRIKQQKRALKRKADACFFDKVENFKF